MSKRKRKARKAQRPDTRQQATRATTPSRGQPVPDRSALTRALLHHDRQIMRAVEARDGSQELEIAYSDAVRAMDRHGLTPELFAAWAHLAKFRTMVSREMSPGQDARQAFTVQDPNAAWPTMLVELLNAAHRGQTAAVHRIAARIDTLDGSALSRLCWELIVLAHTTRTIDVADTAEACAAARQGDMDALDAFLSRVADEENPGLLGLVISWAKLIALTSRAEHGDLTCGDWSLSGHPLSTYFQAIVDGDEIAAVASVTAWVMTVQREHLRRDLLPIVDRVATILDGVGGQERLRASLLLHASYFSAADAQLAQRAALITAAAANGRYDCAREWLAAALVGSGVLSILTGTWLQMAAENTGPVAAQMTSIGLDGIPQGMIDVSNLVTVDMTQSEQREAWRLYHALVLLQSGDIDRFTAAMDAAGTHPDDPYRLLDQLPVTVGAILRELT